MNHHEDKVSELAVIMDEIIQYICANKAPLEEDVYEQVKNKIGSFSNFKVVVAILESAKLIDHATIYTVVPPSTHKEKP